MHVKLRMNLRRPRRKPKYSLATDSELVPRGKGEKNRCERSEIVPEMMCLQGVGAQLQLDRLCPNRLRPCSPIMSKQTATLQSNWGWVTACLLLNESASYYQWRA